MAIRRSGAAREHGARVLLLERAPPAERGGDGGGGERARGGQGLKTTGHSDREPVMADEQTRFSIEEVAAMLRRVGLERSANDIEGLIDPLPHVEVKSRLVRERLRRSESIGRKPAKCKGGK